MNRRTAFPLIYALIFFMGVAATSGAQSVESPIEVVNLDVTLDSATITYDCNQTPLLQKTVRGSVYYPDPYKWGTVQYRIGITPATHWSAITKIDGKTVQDGDIIELTSGQTLPLEVAVTPYSDATGTESYCIAFIHTFGKAGYQCLSLITTNTTAAVNSDLLIPSIALWPNPAAKYIFARNLNDVQAGYRYEIFSISGVEVRQGILPADARINVQDLSSGAYRLLLFDAKQALTSKAFTVLH